MDPNEQVLVVPKDLAFCYGAWVGYRRKEATALFRALTNASAGEGAARYMSRGEVEENPEWKQLIPYITVRRWNQALGSYDVVQYCRTKQAGEKRLRGLASVGIGGHINPQDGPVRPGQIVEIIKAAWRRELGEEMLGVSLGVVPEGILTGFIYDDTTAVGQVHLGLHVSVIVPPAACPRGKDDEVGDVQVIPEVVLASRVFDLATAGQYETWSRIVIASGVLQENPVRHEGVVI